MDGELLCRSVLAGRVTELFCCCSIGRLLYCSIRTGNSGFIMEMAVRLLHSGSKFLKPARNKFV